MKHKQSISHYSGREQQALLRLKNKIVELHKPLIIYLIGCKSSHLVTRNCFANPRNDNQWRFCCDLLLVLSDGTILPESATDELKSFSEDYNRIRLFAHSFDFVEAQIKQYSLFFCWLQRRAIVLYETDNSCQKLPEPVQNMKQYEKQAHEFFAHHPDYENYLEERLSPLPQKPVAEEEQDEIFKPPKLSMMLQNEMARFLYEHGARGTNFRMRQAMIEYVSGVTQTGIPNEFYNILWDFEGLMEFFDLAEEELKK